MKAAYLTGIKKFVIRDDPVPKLRKSHALVRVRATSICGSDLHYYSEGKISTRKVPYPFVLGHETSGEIVAIDKNPKKLSPGDRIAIDPLIKCGKCDACKKGYYNLCRNMKFLASPPYSGSLREYIVFPYENLIKISDDMTFEEAAVAEPLAIVLHVLSLSGDVKNKTAGIIGCGTIGLLLMKLLKLRGIKEIYAVDLVPYRLNIAKKMGAKYTFNASKIDFVKRINSMAPGKGVDISFECAGDIDTFQQALDITTIRGRSIFIGLGPEEVPIKVSDVYKKEPEIRFSCKAADEGKEALMLIKNKKVNVKDIITHRFPLEKTAEAFAKANSRAKGVLKVIIRG